MTDKQNEIKIGLEELGWVFNPELSTANYIVLQKPGDVNVYVAKSGFTLKGASLAEAAFLSVGLIPNGKC